MIFKARFVRLADQHNTRHGGRSSVRRNCPSVLQPKGLLFALSIRIEPTVGSDTFRSVFVLNERYFKATEKARKQCLFVIGESRKQLCLQSHILSKSSLCRMPTLIGQLD